MYGKSNKEPYATICKIDIQWEFAVWLREVKQGICVIMRSGMVNETEERFKREGDICMPMANSFSGFTGNSKFCKAIILQ